MTALSAVLRALPDAGPSASVPPPRRRAGDDEPAPAAPAPLVPPGLPGGATPWFGPPEPAQRTHEARGPAAGLRRRAGDAEASAEGRRVTTHPGPRMPAVEGLQRLVCISEVAPAATEIDVHVIASIAGLHHRRMDVTGVLVHGGGYLLQVAEGRAEAMTAVLRRIEADPHHRAMRVLSDAGIVRRRFDRWATIVVHDPALLHDIGELHRSGQIGEHLMAAIVDRL
jgi:hypothetical protein